MGKEEIVTNTTKINKQNEKNINSNNSTNILELLRDINSYNSNNEIISYFKFAKFYGLLDPEKKFMLQEAEASLRKGEKISLCGAGISIFSSIFLYKRNFYNSAFITLCLTAFPTFYFRYKIKKETNFQLLKLKDDYFYLLERFFKEEKNPLILNPNFLVEDIVDPDMKIFQNMCRLNVLK